MKKLYFPAAVILGLAISTTSCKKENNNNGNPAIKAYTVPATYTYTNVNYTSSKQRSQMAVELDAYLKTANTGTALVPLDQAKVNNMWSNTGNVFSDATLNASGINITSVTANATLIKGYSDSVLLYNTGAVATAGSGGSVPRGANKIIVGPTGLEYCQAYTKGIMGSLFFKEAIRLLTSVKAMSVTDTTKAQAAWDEAFGYLSVPADYDTALVYASTNANRPVLWGGYLAERGKGIQAGGIIFSGFRTGRAAIGGYDKTVRDAQADIIMNKWEQLAAAAALEYVTEPTASSAVGNYGTQLHALSEGIGFISALQYRSATSKLSAADFTTLYNIIHKDFYVLLNQAGFTDLVTAQNILKKTYGL